MSKIIIERAKKSKGKKVKIYLFNGFRFAGKLTNSDEKYLEILDDKSGCFKIIILKEISDMEVEE